MALNTYTENEEKIIDSINTQIESVDYAIAKKAITPEDGEVMINNLFTKIALIMGQSVNRTNY
jgi:hypothetical protein